MAKKKSNTQTESNSHKPQDEIHYPQPMDDAASEKIDSLKSLNKLLLKETVERRQQIDSLIQSNGSLESELNRSVMENASLQSELNSFIERAVMMEIENELMSVFAIEQVNQLAEVSGREMDSFCRDRVAMEERIEGLERDVNRVLEEKSEKESEIRDLNSRLGEQRVASKRVCDERDEIRDQLDAEIREVNGLRLKIIEAEKREAGIVEESTELKVNYDRLVEEKTDVERRIELISNEKDLIQRRLDESNVLVDELKRDREELLKQKKAIEGEKIMSDRKNHELQVSVDELKDLVQKMRIKEEELLEKIADYENKCAESSQKEVGLSMEIAGLVENLKDKEKRVCELAEEKGSVMKDLEEASKKLENQKLTIEQMVEEKIEMEDAKIGAESEIVKMKEQLVEFKSMISSLEKSNSDQNDILEQLEAEVSHYRAAYDKATIEQNEVRESFEEEKTIRRNLQEKMETMEEEIKDLREELVMVIAENGKESHEKNELKDRCATLVNAVALLEAKLVETQKELDETKAKLGLAEANSNIVLKILKNWDENTVLDQENGIEEGIKDHVTEIEAIKRALKDDMKRQLEFLESSVAEAHKGKSFWTMVSSATTVLAAAASVAYVARGH